MTPKTKNHIGLRTLEDISTLILKSHDLHETLQNIVSVVARRTLSDVCSIYLLDDDRQTLRLLATKGLSRRAVGRVTMKVSEGLTGLVVEKRQVVALQEPQNHPRYRYFKETGEERYHSFLGIPLFDRNIPIGVLVIQSRAPRRFSDEDISGLSTIAFQVASIVVNARLLDSIQHKEAQANRYVEALRQAAGAPRPSQPEETAETTRESALRGVVAYPGLASGPAHVMSAEHGLTDILDEEVLAPEQEKALLEEALEKTCIQTIYLEKRMAERLSQADASIFHTHLMILEDRAMQQRLQEEIEEGHGARYAIEKVIGNYVEAFERMEDPYLRERAADMRDIGRRLLANLAGQSPHTLHLKHPGILIAREILPSDMAALDHEQIRGIVTEAGERNSHAVIMAKSLGIPALVGVRGILKKVAPEEHVILDANSGLLHISPGSQVADEYHRLEEDAGRQLHQIEKFRDLPAQTRDGVKVVLRANVGLVSDIDIARRNGAEGVGLYRTEFPYMIRPDFPSRDEQYQLYSRVVKEFNGLPVTIRTLDIGGDKALPYFKPPHEDNPFMGWRSVRVSLDNRDIFRTQIEAILMAACHGPVKMLFPMISGIEEIRACKAVVEEARQNLSSQGIAFQADVPLGMMVEVPAAVQLAERLAREVDFFALGTNDLIQYLLAADRNNALVNRYYDPLHPAVLQVLHNIASIAKRQNKGLCLCGEMANDPLNLLALIGMGIREFSMAAPFIPRMKMMLSRISSLEAEDVAKQVLEMTESSEIRASLTKLLKTTDSSF
ncbi:GAF domain phosphoenolpyruvate--protein phosphotransferase PtsP [Syntrophotalea carbinolica DSM 2380]|uniref:phosphoenolpyruvate--protein phosphotransferase n=1 Tax=Syntrophotalea carbinolica (strain DSM 2380 / NBRC 103641 / GraBd1) TaxID=338963 RepID=Q3A255_SYNC1|nr:phosphoenolpyruvate--protein phosphotransferase [Syntrophotalea carbinolica]ABA89552.1 GAF domain phosphoenolpyruvate--protein phosphotransferase PtsP [Syntrophotalea carbinolica DSM 2380]